jgi:hypothetical protein
MNVKIGNVTVDLDKMSFGEVNDLIQQLREVRARKEKSKHIMDNFRAMIENIRAEGFDFLCDGTGEVLDPKYWVLYDSINHCIYPEKECE